MRKVFNFWHLPTIILSHNFASIIVIAPTLSLSLKIWIFYDKEFLIEILLTIYPEYLSLINYKGTKVF
jgi:hypothetical protein